MLCATVLVAVAAACSSSGGAPAPSVRDSAGIRIVESTAPQWDDGRGWTLSAEPILEIGVMNGDDPYMFDQVWGAARFEDGTLVVANAGDGTLRYFDSTGTHLYSAGGIGAGPAEFTALFGFSRVGDNVAGHQYAQLPSKVFDRQGNFLRAMTPPNVGFPSTPIGVFDDGSLFIVTWPQGRTIRGDVFVDSAHYIRMTHDFARTDTVALLPAVRFVAIQLRVTRQGVPQQFAPRSATAVAEGEWYYGWPQEYELRRYDRNGTLQRIMRRAWEPTPVTSDDVQRYRDESLNRGAGEEVPPQIRTQRLAILDGMMYPEHHPAFDRIMLDRAQNLWVERNDPTNPREAGWGSMRESPTNWDVFDQEGTWLGQVDLPARFWVWEIGDRYVAGVSKDDVDVERVAVYNIMKPA